MTSTSSSVLSKLFPFSSHVWSISSAKKLWYYISSLILFSSIISSLILLLDSVSVSFCKVMSVLKKYLMWTLKQGRFKFPIKLSLFDVLKLFDLLLLTCGLTVVHILFLEMYKIFLPCFLLDNWNATTIYLSLVKYCLNTIKINLENWEDIQCHEHLASIDHVINIIIDSIIIKK